MAWLLALLKSIPALGKILEQLGKVLRNAQANAHVSHSFRDIRAAIKRVRERKSKASERPKDS